jgi:cell division protein FtsQ
MKKRRTTNRKLTSDRDQQKKHIIRGVVKRGSKPQLKAARKNAWRLIKVVFKCAAVAALCYGGWVAYDRLFWRNPDYALSDVAFATDGSLTREQALTTAQLIVGRNIYDYDLDVAREALKAMPQVEQAEVRRYLPNRIEVAITERKPVAWVMNNAQKDERTHLLDARGLVFKPKRILPEYEPLPVISGVELGDLAPGKPIRKSELVAALDLLRLSRESGHTQILSIDVAKGYSLVATDQRHAKVVFGLDDIADQLRRLSLYRNEASNSIPPLEIETVNLMVQYNVPVTFVQPPESAPVEEPPQPESPKIIGADSAKGSKPAPAKKAEPKSKETPKRDGVLKPFTRRAA